MSLYKSADEHPVNEVIIYDQEPEANDVVEMHEPAAFSFNFPSIPEPGVLEVSENDMPNESHKGKDLEVKDPWEWQSGGMKNFLAWVQDRLNSVPTPGEETTGVERCISYLKRFNNEISKAISNDYNGEIDVKTLEVARRWIYKSMQTLEDTYEKLTDSHYRKKKSSDESGMLKEARTPYTGGIVVTVPILISTIARSLINGHVSSGKDITDLYKKQVKKFSLDIRDQASLMQHLQDMGMSLKVDRFYLADEEVPITDNEGELSTQYYS